MPLELWGTAAAPVLTWPDGPPAAGLLVLVAAMWVAVILRANTLNALRSLTRRQWLFLLILCCLSLLLTQLFPLSYPWVRPLLRETPATSVMALLSAVPYLLAGLVFNAPAAMIAGLFAGLGRAAGQTGAPVDIFAVSLAAGLSAGLLRQNYAGRLFGTLRKPVVAGPLGRLVLAGATFLDVLTSALPQAGLFGALDLALYLALWSAVPLIIEGVVSGAITTGLLWMAPQWRPNLGEVPSPFQRSLQRQLITAFLAFAAIVVLLSSAVAFIFASRSAERSLAARMVDYTDAAAARLGALQGEMAATLAGIDSGEGVDSDPAAKSAALGALRASNQFLAVSEITESGEVLPAGVGGNPERAAKLSQAEERAITDALAGGAPRWSVDGAGGATTVTLAVPRAASGGGRAVLLAHIDPAALAATLDGPATFSNGNDLIVSETSHVVAGDASGEAIWQPPLADHLAPRASAATGRDIFEITDPATGARQLVTYTTIGESGWKVVAFTPHAAILRQALGIIGPLALLLLAISALFYLVIAALGRSISRPIGEMSQASRAIAGGGGLERPVRSQRGDEIGQLSLAFSQMQRALRQRLDELSLLLSVSNDVAATIDLDQGMSAVLQGVLRGTGAAGARAIVRNPSVPTPLIFGEGPAADSLALLDRPVVLYLRSADELALGSAAEIQATLGIDNPPAAALFAVPLKPAGEFQGALYVAYRQPHYFDRDELSLLRTLAGQATVLVQNAYLFTAAEGGRRRLAAILASTTNAVIVTDQTDRVLLINPAMAQAFGLRAAEVTGRPVLDALSDPGATPLARRLSLSLSAVAGDAADGKLELEVNGRAFLAGISTVSNREGQKMGRVAVLQDMTESKEANRMKSDFLAGVSHDLLSPLTYMHNYASLLPVEDDPALEKEYAERILSGVDRMTRMVNDILDLAEIEAGINIQLDRVNVGEVLAEIAQEYASPAKARGVRLVVEAAADLLPAKVDPALLRRAMTNLVTNGLKYAPDSGPLVLRAEAGNGEIIISVRDRGPGIPLAAQAYLFEKFYRGEEAATERERGTGLGLAVVKSVADHHGGRVWCESAPGEGSAFYLALPQA